MQEFRTIRRVRHPASDMFELVADIERYPEFVPLCEAIRVRERVVRPGHRRDVLTADMTVAYKFFRETFASRVTLDRPDLQILVEYLDGPFKTLENRWRFHGIDADCSKVEFYIAYEFRSRALQLMVGGLFDKAFRKFAEAFEARADAVYGVRTPQALEA